MKAIFPYYVEEELKEQFFKGKAAGYFVDVGANEPHEGSQTWHFEKRGWNGVVIEPQPELAEKHRRQRNAKVYAAACSSPENSGKLLQLHIAGINGIHTSLNPEFFVAGTQLDRIIDVPVKTLDEILLDAQAPSPIDLVSIDVESHEIEVLLGFDLQRWRPRLIFIEDLVTDLRLHRFLQSRGYKWFRRTGLNSWYVPADTQIRIGVFGKLQFIRKYYLGTPIRRARNAKRRLLARLRKR